MTEDKKKRTDVEKNKMIEDAKEKRDQQLRKQRLKKNAELPDFNNDDFVPTVVKSEIGSSKVHPRAQLHEDVKDIMDDPVKLEKYKKKHFKNITDTKDIDALIHRAYQVSAKSKMTTAVSKSETFEKELRLKINRARAYLVREKQKGTLKAKSLLNATISNNFKTIESFLFLYPVEPDRRAALVNKGDSYGRTAIFYA